MPRNNETHAAFVARWNAARGFTKKDVSRRSFWPSRAAGIGAAVGVDSVAEDVRRGTGCDTP